MTGSRGNKDFAGFKNHEETWKVIYSVEEYFLIWVALAYNYQDISVDLMIKLSWYFSTRAVAWEAKTIKKGVKETEKNRRKKL